MEMTPFISKCVD